MATLIVPTKITRFKTYGRWTKWHLIHTHEQYDPKEFPSLARDFPQGQIVTECARYYDLQDGTFELSDVADVKAADLCIKCLGPLVAKD